MGQVRVESFGISLDGYAAALSQGPKDPIGVGGMKLMEWPFGSQSSRTAHDEEGGTVGIDNDWCARGFANLGAWVLGRNMFGPVRGAWRDESWKGWWGDSPPFHTPVFLMTHFPRASITMQGNTVFHFVEGDISEVLQKAREAAKGKDVRLGGGVNVVRQALRARLVDAMHLAVNPLLLGHGRISSRA